MRVFVGSSTTAQDLCTAIVKLLNERDDIHATHWRDVFAPGDQTLSAIEQEAERSDFGVFILHADDQLVGPAGGTKAVTRDNVLLEYGIFAGKLGQNRSLLVGPNDWGVHLPSDVLGITLSTWNTESERETAAVRPGVLELWKQMQRIGPREPSQTPLVFAPEEDLTLVQRYVRESTDVVLWGVTLSAHLPLLYGDIREAALAGTRFRILLIKPEGAAMTLAAARASDYAREEMVASLHRTRTRIASIALEKNVDVELRQVDYLPPYVLYAFDPESEDKATASVRLSNYKGSNAFRPTLLINKGRDGRWFEHFYQQFCDVWADAEVVVDAATLLRSADGLPAAHN